MEESKKTENEMRIPQPRLDKGGMIALITMCNAIAPLSTDMYMPALPDMAAYFKASDSVMNLTLVVFFLFFALGMLVFGPISDKIGRRKTMLFGILLYIAASVACGLAMNVYFLIVVRILQAIGAGCMIAVSTAIVKDQFSGSTQGTVLAVAQAFSVLGPVIAPLLGAQIYRFFSWRADFFMQAIITGVILLLALLMKETLPKEERLDTGVLRTFGRLGTVLKNKKFTAFMISIIIIQIPMMSYIASSAYIYENQFGLSSTMYSIYFAGTALVTALGPILYIRVRKASSYRVSFGIFAICAFFGVLMFLIGHNAPIAFAACFAPIMMMSAISRPFATAILLNMQRGDTGSASSLTNFSFTIMGAVGMSLITSLWKDYILGISMLAMITGLIGILFCLVLRAKLGSRSLG